jgi:uncharacterized membrane protein YczE
MHRLHIFKTFAHIPPWRWLQFTVGILMLSFGVSLMVRANIGLGPWDVLHQGVSIRTGMDIGTAIIIIGLLIMLLWIPLGERPGPGTVLNVLCVGLLINAWLDVLPVLGPGMLSNMLLFPAQVAQMAAGIVIMGIGSGMYISSGLGAGPRDGVMMGLVHRTGLSVRIIRTILELTALLAGWLLGGTVGLGTILFAFGVGPVVHTTLHSFQRWQERTSATLR